MRGLIGLEKVFIRLAKNYIRKYPKHSFKFYFDDIECPILGKSKKVIVVKFRNSRKFFKRVFTEGSIGLGECYCNGMIDVKDSDYRHLLMMFVRAGKDKRFFLSLPFLDKLKVLKAILAGKVFSRKSPKANINAHYSLSDWFENDEDSNKFYTYWLDKNYVQYTCARWDKDTKTLDQAQVNKFEYYAKRLGINKSSKGKTVLDLGCGWGGFMFYLAKKYGVICKGITLSTAQGKFIRQQARRKKLQGKVSVEVGNAMELSGKYDFIVSIGMLEHIDDYHTLFRRVAKALNPKSSSLFHAMFYKRKIYRPDPFLSKYIFPGGSIPSVRKTPKILRKYFRHVSRQDMPDLSYPKTLACWYKSFCDNEEKIRNLLKNKSKVKNIDWAIRLFKHYLMLAEDGLTVDGLVSNFLVKN